MSYPEGSLPVYTIYDHPADYPDEYVARTFLVTPDSSPQATNETFASTDLDMVRRWVQHIAPGSVRLDRSEEDHPTVLESWL